jgi:cardiolipin synthase
MAKVKTAVQVAAIAALIASSATERMLPGVTIGALIGMWVAAALTFYTGYAYLQAGLSHTQRDGRRQGSVNPDDDEPVAHHEQRPA